MNTAPKPEGVMGNYDRCRRMYFALLKKLGVSEENRHAFNEAVVGKRSTKDWNMNDWMRAINRLKRDAGQKQEPPQADQARVREGPGAGSGVWCTGSQASLVLDLISEIQWDELERTPKELLLTTVLKGPEKELRRQRVEVAWQKPRRPDAPSPHWRMTMELTRKEASDFIQALKKIKRYHPLGKARQA